MKTPEDWRDAERRFKQAMTIDPVSPERLSDDDMSYLMTLYGHNITLTGRAIRELKAARARIRELDPDPVVCNCREAGCPHTPIAKLPRQALVDHYKERIRTVEADRDRLEASIRADAERIAELETKRDELLIGLGHANELIGRQLRELAEHDEKLARCAQDNVDLQAQLGDALIELAEHRRDAGEKLDALLNHCDKEYGECSVCSIIICPHKDPLHFHHDGCPSCYFAERDAAAQGERET